jgi:hypothetical protein
MIKKPFTLAKNHSYITNDGKIWDLTTYSLIMNLMGISLVLSFHAILSQYYQITMNPIGVFIFALIVEIIASLVISSVLHQELTNKIGILKYLGDLAFFLYLIIWSLILLTTYFEWHLESILFYIWIIPFVIDIILVIYFNFQYINEQRVPKSSNKLAILLLYVAIIIAPIFIMKDSISLDFAFLGAVGTGGGDIWATTSLSGYLSSIGAYFIAFGIVGVLQVGVRAWTGKTRYAYGWSLAALIRTGDGYNHNEGKLFDIIMGSIFLIGIILSILPLFI